LVTYFTKFKVKQKEAVPAHVFCTLALLPSLSEVSEALSACTGDLAQPAASFSDQLPVISCGGSVSVLNGMIWSPFTGHWSLALTVAGQRRDTLFS
jgi:hypothetical protein